MTFQRVGLPFGPFAPLFSLDDKALSKLQGQRVTADAVPGYPCRVSFADAQIGEAHLMIDAALCDGKDAASAIIAMFGNGDVAYIHLHNAKRGCFSCRADRVQRNRQT
ncbi:MAG: hypothetical protein NVS1B6_01450 [Steroidobacteraceae bacterium]